jgi:hypothetical protein
MAGMATTNMEVTSRATTDSLTRLAAEQQRRFDAMTLPRARKEWGHFGTSPAIADFMAAMFSTIPSGPMRILDPGAGVGTLSAAVCQRILRQHSRRRLFFELFENDPKLIPLLEKTMTLAGAGGRAYKLPLEFLQATKGASTGLTPRAKRLAALATSLKLT